MGYKKYISIVGLFPTVIADQRSLSFEKQIATPAQMQFCTAVNRVQMFLWVIVLQAVGLPS